MNNEQGVGVTIFTADAPRHAGAKLTQKFSGKLSVLASLPARRSPAKEDGKNTPTLTTTLLLTDND
jgi:hypothetical protein